MNNTGKMTALKLTYEDSKQYQMGVTRGGKPGSRNREIKTAYQGPKNGQDVLRADPRKNTYVNHPNKSYEILRKKEVVQSKILTQASDPRVKAAVTGLKGTLHNQMENVHLVNSTKSINNFKSQKHSRNNKSSAS